MGRRETESRAQMDEMREEDEDLTMLTCLRASRHSIGSLDRRFLLLRTPQMHSPVSQSKKKRKEGKGEGRDPKFSCSLSGQPAQTGELTTTFEELTEEIVIDGIRKIPTE
jgi:hypothetical protein